MDLFLLASDVAADATPWITGVGAGGIGLTLLQFARTLTKGLDSLTEEVKAFREHREAQVKHWETEENIFNELVRLSRFDAAETVSRPRSNSGPYEVVKD